MVNKGWLALAAGMAIFAAQAQSDRITNGQQIGLGAYIVSGNKQFFATQQGDGNLCVYKGSGPNDNRGYVWCHMQHPGNGNYYAVQQSDGNLCTYKVGQKGAVWCHMGRGVPREGKWVTIIQNDANFCTYPADRIGAGNAIWCTMALASPAPAPLPAPAAVQAYAPLLRFDSGSAGYSYPMSADDYFKRVVTGNTGITRLENADPKILNTGQVPVYYTIKQVGRQYRIRYWIFYGFQAPCIANQGTHNGDWEDITVITTEGGNGIAAVLYGQHGGRYMRIAGPRDAPCTPGGIGRCGGSGGFQRSGTHPVAYIGRIAHGTFHDANGEELAKVPGGACAYYGDSRDGRGPTFETWRKLVSLDGGDESWLARDRQGNFPWGPDGVNTHPTTAGIPTQACTGVPTAAAADAGCWKSECLSGDDEASEDCLKECKHGYTNVGLTCNKGKWPWEWSVYGRLTGGNKYGYRFNIPTTDAGLSRRRSDDGEWSLP